MKKNKEAQAKTFKMPHTYVILIGITICIAILSYFIPASNYDTVQVGEQTVVDPNTFHYVEQTPVKPMQLLTAIPRGLQEASQITFFIFILGGAFSIVNSTRAMEVGVGNLAKRMQNHPGLVIPVLVAAFSLLGATAGMLEETLVFIPICVMLARNLGYDAMVGTAVVFLGASSGFNSGFMNPFTVGVAQTIAELPMFSGLSYRLILWIVFVIITSLMILAYAKKVKANPEASLVYDLEQKSKDQIVDINNVEALTKTHITVLILFMSALIFIVYGIINWGFGINEIAGVFLALGIISGFIGGFSPSEMAVTFIQGAKDIAMGALVVGIARSILVVLNDGQIIYTIVHSASILIQKVSTNVAAIFMFLFQLLLNFFIPSGSGQAATTMPIMTPLADITGISRQTAVLAFHMGDGISNSIIPTGGALLAALSMTSIDYEKWVKFAWKIVLAWTLVACVFAGMAGVIGYK